MKVYARYFEENELGFRRDTVLQFRDGWDLIGSIILINPGSATPLNRPIETKTLEKLLSITQTSDPNSWKEFSIDPTMWQIAKLFSGQFIGQDRPLNGIIQLFNLFNLRNANLYEALECFKTTSNTNIVSIEDDVTRIGKMPVYFGWGNSGKHQLKDIAKKIFETLPQQSYLNDNFENNPFYHPRYLQMSCNKNGNVIKILHDFYNQNQEYIWDGVIKEKNNNLAKGKKEEIVKICVKELEKRWDFHEKKNNRFVVARGYLSLTITHTGDGYVGIRYINKDKIEDDTIQSNLIDTLKKYNFLSYINKHGKFIWLGSKKIRDFQGNTSEDISSNILSELTEIISELENIYS